MSTSSVSEIRRAAAPLLERMPPAVWLPHGLVRLPSGKLDKPPRGGATSNNPASWLTIDGALQHLVSDQDVHGIAFAIVKGLIALDFDDCRDPYTGLLDDEVQVELERMNSFAYVTPSGKGIRIVGINNDVTPIKGQKTNLWMIGGHKIEVYVGPTNFYNTFTSQIIPGYETLRDISGEVLDCLESLDHGRKGSNGSTTHIQSAEPQRSMAAIRAALKVIPNDKQDWDEWCRIGMAVFRSSGGKGDGLDAWIAWSAKHPCHEQEKCEERWQHWFSSPPTKIGFGSLYFEARQHNPLFVPPFDQLPEPSEGIHAPETAEEFSACPIEDMDLDRIPPRRWIYGRELVRGFVSVLASPGGTGKTAYTMAVAVSVAWNRSLLHGGIGQSPLHVAVHKTGPVWLYNLEDPEEELRRRIRAVIDHHKVPRAELKGKIFLNSGRDRPLIVAIRNDHGDLIASPVVDPLIAEIKKRRIAVLVVDPFVQSHSAEENRNEEMNTVMATWGRVASQADCAVWLVHHFRKGGATGDGEAVRGAGAIQGAARSMFTMGTMSPDEATTFNIDHGQRWQYVRHDNAKQNMAPPATSAVWYHLASVHLGNGDADYPDGDHVQAVEVWAPPGPWENVGWDKIEQILAKIDKGPSEGEFYAISRQAKDRWAGYVIMDKCSNSYAQAMAMLKQWKDNGVLEDGQYVSKTKRATLACVRVNQVKFSEMKQAKPAMFASSNDD